MRKALIAVCHNMPFVYTKTAASLVEFGWGDRIPYCREKLGFESIVFKWYGSAPRVDMLRNKACTDALRDGFTHLVFLDADMIWPSTTVYDLLSHHDKGIVAGLYVLKGPPYGPVHLVNRQDAESEQMGADMFFRATDYTKALVPVDVVGMGCTIIPVEAVRAIGDKDWFHYDTDKDGWPVVSEDVPFCLAAKKCGYSISMDPSIRCGHVGVQVFDERFHKRWQAAEAASQEQTVDVTMPEAV